ncbi:hypothetical protein CQ11_05980 [Trueperella pyogenes]|nr:hypothetical protein CQ11_05980 [Trueperella pyogenes]
MPTTAGGLHQTLPQARRDSRDDGEPAERIDLIGHSIGGLAALEWAFTDRVDSLTLLDPTTLDDAGTLHLPVGWAAPFGPAVRKLAMWALAGRDELSATERRARFGTVRGLQALATQLRQLPDLQARVTRLLPGTLPPTRQLVALPRFGSDSFRDAQRELAHDIGSEIVELPGWNHLFPIAHPAEVAALITARQG